MKNIIDGMRRMKDEIKILEINSMDPRIVEELSNLLVSVVEDGASIGFLPPLIGGDANEYWKSVIQPDVILWIAMKEKLEGRSLLVLDTRSGDPSNNLYISLGYVEAGRIPNYARSSGGGLDDTIFYYKEI